MGTSSSTAISGAETPPGVPPFGIPGTSASSDNTRVGWTAGAGTEYQFAANWTVKAEWLHYDLGSETYSQTLTASLSGVPEFTNVSTTTVRFRGDIIRAGINYQFH